MPRVSLQLGLERLLRWVLGAMTFAMLALILVTVVSRYVLGDPIIWGEEATRFVLVWMTFLGAGLASKYGKDLAARELAMLLPARVRRVLDLGILVTSMLFLSVFIAAGIGALAVAHGNRSEILEIPYSIVYLAAPLGGSVMILYLGARLRTAWRQDSSERTATDR